MHAPLRGFSASSPSVSSTGPHDVLTVTAHTTSGTSVVCKPPSSSHALKRAKLSTSYFLCPSERHVYASIDPGGSSGHEARQASAAAATGAPTPHEHTPMYLPPQFDAKDGSTVGRKLQPTHVATGAARSASQSLQEKGVSVLGTDTAGTVSAMQQLNKQLDRFKKRHLFLGQFEMLGSGAVSYTHLRAHETVLSRMPSSA